MSEALDYNAISSVWTGTDAALLDEMLDFYPVIDSEPILDATHNTGRIWRGSERDVVSMDIDPKYEPDIVADNREMPSVEDGSYAVVVYDPPHVGPHTGTKAANVLMLTSGRRCLAGSNTAGA